MPRAKARVKEIDLLAPLRDYNHIGLAKDLGLRTTDKRDKRIYQAHYMRMRRKAGKKR